MDIGMKTLREKMKDGFVFFDGGCGTLLQAAGLKAGELPETWNITHADEIKKIHYDYLMAGSNILKTNTFGANSLKFSDDGEYSLKNVVERAIDIAREAVAEAEAGNGGAADSVLEAEAGNGKATGAVPSGEHYIALDIGPLGKLLKPLGDLDFEDAVSLFRKTISIGAEYGVDLILIETMNDIYEAKAAVLAAKETCDLPVFLTTAYDASGKLLTGADAKTVVAVAEGLGVDALGINCSLGPEQMMGIVEELAEYASVPVIVNPNAGIPRTENGKTVYDVTPDRFREAMVRIAGLGGRILGGCCGTTPQHISSMVSAVKELMPLPLTFKEHTLIASYTHSVEFSGKPVLIGERINPTGKSKFKQALRDHNMDYILQEGLTQQEKKADVLDVNVGLPEIDEAAMMKEVVMELQGVTDLPLQIDTTDSKAMEQALRRYNGKAMVNSVNGKEEVMREVFPLVKKYGGLVVALTIDEDGIPETAEGRLAIVDKIYKKAAEYGIAKKDIIIDPLAMSVSADKESAKVTLDSLKGIKERYQGRTSLGVSNISFGLPNRDFINAAFFTMAMQNGLDAAIMNPGSGEMMKAYYTFCALQGYDENFADYIDYASSLPAVSAAPKTSADSVAESGKAGGVTGSKTSGTEGKGADQQDPLIEAIVKGLKERAAHLTEEYLQTMESIEIIDGKLIPALDIVGKGFEEKRVFLPQLLMSAEAAKSAFDVIKEKMQAKGAAEEKKGRIILATVKGDIHDIGKNIVKVLLENYGYDVIDLGKDVPPELIVKTAKEEGIRLIGLSALMTTTVPAMEETIKMIHEQGIECKVMVGGAVLTQEYADMIHADKYAKDAMESVRYAEKIFA